jgi:hypothetical protein
LSNLYTPKTPIKPYTFCAKMSNKYIKRFGKYLENQGKRFVIVMFYLGVVILGYWVSFDPPLQACLLILAIIAGRGINKDDRNVSSIRYNTKPRYLDIRFEGLGKVQRFFEIGS